MIKENRLEQVGVALVLGAGGSRGSILTGVLEVLEKHNIPIDLIVGSSVGSFVGAMYAYYGSAEIVRDKVLQVRFEDIVDISLLHYFLLPWRASGLSKGNNLLKMLSHQLPECDISELKIPLVVVATDTETFDAVGIDKGDLIQAVLASSSVPPYFSPVMLDGKALLDGGISSPVPTEIAKQYKPKVTIAVNITQHYFHSKYNNMLSISYKSLSIANYQLSKFQSYLADVIITTDIDVDGSDDSKALQLYEAGKKATLEQIDKIKKLVLDI